MDAKDKKELFRKEIAEEQEGKKLISKHIFLFPFTFDFKRENELYSTTFRDRTDVEEIHNLLDKNKWIREELTEKWDLSKISLKTNFQRENDQDNKNFLYNYNTYFYENVKKAMNPGGEKDSVMYSYKYNLDKGGTFEIKVKNYETKGEKESGKDYKSLFENKEKGKVFKLEIEKIGLRFMRRG